MSTIVDQAQATAGKDLLNELITSEGINRFQTATVPAKDSLQAGLGPWMPEPNAEVVEAFDHESRPKPILFRNQKINCTDWQTSQHHEVAVQSGGVWPIVQADALAWYQERLEFDEHR